MRRLLALLLAAVPLVSAADEGMWTFDAFPSDEVARRYGFRPSQAWLDHVRLSSVRFAGGCSGSFVSPTGLVMTNHHCVHECVEQLSTAEGDLVEKGFLAPTPAAERRCPDVEVNQLVAIRDVTERVRGRTRGLEGEAYQRALRGAMAQLEKECQTSDDLRCDVVTLHHGRLYHLYRYRRFQDVRLVFAPEFAIAFFGGDPDNFEFPRYDLDVAFVRVYEGGAPARVKDFFRWSAAGPSAGELAFVSGHPGGTDRALTLPELVYQRDVVLPDAIARLAELRGLLTGFALLGPEERRVSKADLFYAENGLKVYRGRSRALADPEFFGRLVARSEEVKALVTKDPARRGEVLAAYEGIAKAQDRLRELRDPYEALEKIRAGRLHHVARLLVRAAAEHATPNEERLRELRESNLPVLAQEVLSDAPVHPELERLLLGHALEKLRERLGPDHAAVRRILGEESPAELAERVVRGTRLASLAERRRLWGADEATVKAAAKDDPLLALALLADADARSARKRYEDEVESVVKRGHETLAQARFAAEGRATYPDATFTLRLSYGAVEGWVEDGKPVPPFTTFSGAFERHTGRDPFALPPSWLAAKPRLALGTRLDLVTTNDIIGGNSGSPVLDAKAEIVGLVFDGNIHSLGGNYGYDPAVNRTVAVASDGILEALRTIYRADGLVEELLPAAPAARGGKASRTAGK
jgi:hypothetical protein